MIAAGACVILGAAIAATVLAGSPRDAAAARLEAGRERHLKREQAARTLAAAHAYETMLTRRLLTPAAPPVPDPGNPGAALRLAIDVYGAVTERGGRVLLVQNPADGLDVTHALPVPPDVDDPVTAAAWTYDVPRSAYLQLARRT